MSDVLHGITVNRASPVPLYFQVAQQMEGAIDSGAIPSGTRLDNEAQIAERFGLSRPTVRQAMQHLSDRGLIVRRRGVGTTVVQPKVRRPLELTSLHDDLVRTGQRPSTTVLRLGEEPADADAAEALGVAEGDPVLAMVRVRSAGRRPIAVMTNHLPAGLLQLSTTTLREEGLYARIRAAGITLSAATQVIGARLATAEEAGLLGEQDGAAVLTMERIAYDDGGAVVELGRHIYAASRYSLQMSLHIG